MEKAAPVTSVCAALNRGGVNYLVIGGVACILHGYARATDDIDILIERTAANAARVLKSLRVSWSPAQLLKAQITTLGNEPSVHVFTVAWTVKYEQAAPNASTVTVNSVRLPLISIDDLIATKRTGRLQDAADIEALEEIRRR